MICVSDKSILTCNVTRQIDATKCDIRCEETSQKSSAAECVRVARVEYLREICRKRPGRYSASFVGRELILGNTQSFLAVRTGECSGIIVKSARPGSPSVESRLGLPNRGGGMILGTPAETGGFDALAAGAGLRAGLAGSGIGRGGRANSGGGGAVWRQPVLCVEGAFATSQDRRDHAGAAAQPCGAAFGAALRRAAGAGGRAGGRDDCGVAGLGEARAWHRGQPSGDVVGPGPTGPDAKKNGCGRPNRTAPMSPKHAPHGPS